jgi:hypothetical protein
MRTRVLVGANALLAIGLVTFVWNMLPFAQGVLCDSFHLACSPLSPLYLAIAALVPGLILLALAWIGAKLATRKPFWSDLALLLGPIALLSWVALVWVSSTS